MTNQSHSDAKTVLTHCAEKVDGYWWCVTCEGRLGTGPQPDHDTVGTGDDGHAPNCPVAPLAASEVRVEALESIIEAAKHHGSHSAEVALLVNAAVAKRLDEEYKAALAAAGEPQRGPDEA